MTSAVSFAASQQLSLRAPDASDGAKVRRLIAASGALDENSLYCNLLQCSHFAQTCVLAEAGDEMFGWMSAYIPPQTPDRLFIWQICVDPAARGTGLAQRMIQNVLDRDECRGVTHLECTITRGNDASWALFRSVSRKLEAPLESSPHFLRETHLDNRHDCEHRVSIGPLAA